jgi:hypothetical protein
LGPAQFRQAADRLAFLLNQDGDMPDDADRARRRYLTIEKQQAEGMSRIHGLIDPECRATVEAVLAKWAAPGMCNPDDEAPCVDGEPGEEAVHSDTRSQGQRNHDALKAMGRSVLASGELGKHNGLPATIIVSTTLQDLQSAAGVAVTAGGTLLPMREGDQAGFPGSSLLGDLRQTHPRAALLRARQTLRRTSPNSPWPAGPITAWSKRAAGLLENAKTAVRSGSHPHT